MLIPFLTIGIGAALGAWARWGLGLLLNHLFPTIPLGTLAANLIGSFLIGICLALFSTHTIHSPNLRLGIVTGFLGALTTFSTFSAEVVQLLTHHQWTMGLAALAAHVVGSLVVCILGIYLVRLITT